MAETTGDSAGKILFKKLFLSLTSSTISLLDESKPTLLSLNKIQKNPVPKTAAATVAANIL